MGMHHQIRRRITLFRHVTACSRGSQHTHALRAALGVRCGSIPNADWKRPCGWPRTNGGGAMGTGGAPPQKGAQPPLDLKISICTPPPPRL